MPNPPHPHNKTHRPVNWRSERAFGRQADRDTVATARATIAHIRASDQREVA